MKKSNFITMIMGTIGGIIFALGMCMCLLPEWNAFKPGMIIGSIGCAILLATVIAWRKMTGKKPIHLNAKTIGITIYSILSSIILGVGMSLAMVFEYIALGTIIGIVGIIMLLCIIPLLKGLK